MKQRSPSKFERRKAFTTILVLCAAVVGSVAVPAAQAQVTRNEIETDRPLSLPVECPSGQWELLSGTIAIHILETSTTNDTHVTKTYHSQVQGGVLVGATTGEVYRLISLTQEKVTESRQNGLYTLSFQSSFRIIGRGPGNNSIAHFASHVTITPNGEVAVEFERLTDECR